MFSMGTRGAKNSFAPDFFQFYAFTAINRPSKYRHHLLSPIMSQLFHLANMYLPDGHDHQRSLEELADDLHIPHAEVSSAPNDCGHDDVISNMHTQRHIYIMLPLKPDAGRRIHASRRIT